MAPTRRPWPGLLAAVVLVVAACSPAGAPEPRAGASTPTGSPAAGPAQASSGVFQAYLPEPRSIDPGRAIDSEELTVVDQLFDSLTAVEVDGTQTSVAPGAAVSWEANPPPGPDATADAPPPATVWTFTLRRGMTFHDGTPLTAQAFRRGWERIADRTGEQPSAAHYLLEPIAGFEQAAAGGELTGVELVDDLTLRITLTAPVADLPAVLSHPALAPVPASAVTDPEGFGRLPVGNGPFRMAAPIEAGQFIRLQPHEGYVGPAPVPTVDEVVFQIYAGDRAAEDAYDEFEKGFLELAPVPPSRWDEAVRTYGRSPDGHSGTGVLDGIEMITAAYGFNDDLAPFDDPDVRRAISLLIDRDAIVGDVAPDRRAPARSIVPPGIEGYRPADCPYCEHDPERARVLVAEEELPPFELVYLEGPDHDAVARRIQRDVNAVLGEGTVTLRPLPHVEWLDSVREGRAGFFLTGWLAEYPTPDAFLYAFHGSRIGRDNVWHYDEPEVNDLLDRARSELDGATRADLYRQVEGLVLDDVAVAPLFHYRHARVVADRVEGFSLSPLGYLDLTRVTVRAPE